jgi:hypothetical protein
MTRERWAAVDRYLADLFAPSNDALDEALASAASSSSSPPSRA